MPIEKTFAQHKPSELGLEDIAKLREAYSTLLKLINAVVPNSREKALAVTHLETSSMFATKGITHNDPNSTVIE